LLVINQEEEKWRDYHWANFSGGLMHLCSSCPNPAHGEKPVTLSKLQEYYVPKDGNAVVELLARYKEGATIVAGGTFMHGLIARGLVTDVEVLVDISRLDLAYVKRDKDKLRIGATTTFTQLGISPDILDDPLYGAITDALGYPPPQVKNSATIGGCVAASCPFFDLPVSFLALDSAVHTQGQGTSRNIALADFFAGLFENTLKQGEFMRELSIPIPAGKTASAFLKLETNANDLAILNAAALVSVDKSGKCAQSRVFVGGGVGEVPVRSPSAEKTLQGKALTPELCIAAGTAAKSDVEPLSDHRASAEYRKAMAGVLVERVLKQALNRLG
jgi:aerobic carbon-monoxide dehydrogenase medium subunit